MGGTSPLFLRNLLISPISGAAIGAAFGSVVGAFYCWMKSGVEGTTPSQTDPESRPEPPRTPRPPSDRAHPLWDRNLDG